MSVEKLLAWSFPAKDLPQALQAILVPSGLPLRQAALPPVGITTPERWLLEAPRALGLEATTSRVQPEELESALETAGPALLRIETSKASIAIAAMTGFPCRIYSPDGTSREISPRQLRCDVFNASAHDLANAPWRVGLQRGAELIAALAESGELGSQRILITRFRPDAAHPIWSQACQDGARGLLVSEILLSLLRAAIGGLAAFALGSAALSGRIDTSRLVGWTLIVLSDIPLSYLASMVYGRFSIAIAAAVKRRLLEGTFQLSPDEVRGAGLGGLLARLSEAGVLEHGGLSTVMALVTPFGLWAGTLALAVRSPWPYLVIGLLFVFTVVALWLAWQEAQSYVALYRRRLELTDDLVEKIVGHRTRILQRTASVTHAGEDESLYEYAAEAKRFDKLSSFSAGMSRGWQIVALIVVSAAFFQREPALFYLVITAIAAREVWSGITTAALTWAPWYCAWKALKPMIEGGRLRDKPWRPLPEVSNEAGRRSPTLTISNLSFNHPTTSRPILRDIALQVFEGERLLLEGDSGSGKSTLASLIASERRPSAGTILVRGLDMDSVPKAEWRTRVAYAPQFHENYVFSSTFAFNLDPRADLGAVSDEARQICDELGLGPLLARMPSSFVQTLGETGWQLSHGEKSRMYIARTLLQGAELVIFDESFGALDPETVEVVMRCVRKRARTLLVIAHP